MDLSAILETLRSLSPLVAVCAILLVAWIAWVRHLDKKTDAAVRKSDEAKLAKELAESAATTAALTNKTVALNTAVSKIGDKTTAMQTMIEAGHQLAEQRFNKQIDVLVQIHEQLVRLNAAHATVINPDNAKRIIQYQWSWCRDETARLLVNSIRNNSFRGREDIVSRKVYEFWRKAAEGSLESLLRLEGLQYPYSHLFTSHLAVAWSTIWQWAVPVYHSSHTDDTFAYRLEDLETRVKNLFDQIIVLHYSLVEDIDHGLFYSDAKEKKSIAVINDQQAPQVMATQLRTFKPGTTDRIQPSAELRAVMARAIVAERQASEPTGSGLRPKSGVFDPAKQP